MATHHNVLIEVLTASAQWIAHFNAGRVQDCINTYTPQAIMNAAPAGSFRGRAAIASFWGPFVESGAGDLVYTDIALEMDSSTRVRLRARWRMNVGRGIITNELWQLDDDGRWRLAEDDFEVQEQFS